LKGWVKDFRPPTLQDAIKKTQDMEETTVRKAPVNTFIPHKGKETKFLQQTWTGKGRLDEDTRRELRRNKIFSSCKDPWELGHRCMGRERSIILKYYLMKKMKVRRRMCTVQMRVRIVARHHTLKFQNMHHYKMGSRRLP